MASRRWGTERVYGWQRDQRDSNSTLTPPVHGLVTPDGLFVLYSLAAVSVPLANTYTRGLRRPETADRSRETAMAARL